MLNTWYDEGFTFVRELLNGFTELDWDKLISISKNRNIDWKKKLVYCLNGDYNRGLELIREFIQINDRELQEMCIDSLRDYEATTLKKFILGNYIINEVLLDLKLNSGCVFKIILDDLMLKINMSS